MRNSLASFQPVTRDPYPAKVRKAISELIAESPIPDATITRVSRIETNFSEEEWIVRSYAGGTQLGSRVVIVS